MLFSDVTPEYAAVLEAGRLEERGARERALRMCGRPESEIAAVMARYDEVFPTWVGGRKVTPVVHAPARRASTVAARPVMMATAAAMMATGVMTF